jgi:hypothetical protein
MREQQCGCRRRHAGGKFSARLSPSALAHWPAVAKKKSDADVLGAVDEESLIRYCEARNGAQPGISLQRSWFSLV